MVRDIMTPENKDKLLYLLGSHFHDMRGPAQSQQTQRTDLGLLLRDVKAEDVPLLLALLNEAKRDAFPDNVIRMEKFRK